MSTRNDRGAVVTTRTQGRAAGIRGGDRRYPSCPEGQLPASRSGRYLLDAAWNRGRNEESSSAGASLRAALWELGGVPHLYRTEQLIAAVHDHCDKGSGEGQAPNLETMGNLRNLILGACPLIPRPMARRQQRQSRSLHRTCQGPRQGQGSSRLIGDQADHLPREVTPGAEGLLGAPTYQGIEHVQEPNRQEAGHPGTFPDRPERNAAGPASSPNRAAEGRGTWRPGVLQPKERGPASLLRANRHSCLPPLAGAGPARWHRLGRLARSRAATRGLGIRSLAARAFGSRRGSLRHAVRGNHRDGR
jgi:hypothetical protein